MTEVTAPASNGAGQVLTPREQLLEQARAQADALVERREELAAALADLDRDRKAYERAIAALDPAAAKPAKPGPKPKDEGPVRKYQSRVGPERMVKIEAAVRQVARENDGNVLQVQVRDVTGYSSSIMTNAFKQLREDDVLRYAGVDKSRRGVAKIYKLTRPALREETVQ